MTDHNGSSEPKRILAIDWQEEGGFEISLQLRPSPNLTPLLQPQLLLRPDTTPPFRQAS
jgi:hypothetical protein